MLLEGVRIGPMDPDSTADFGTVGAKNSAKTLIRRHAGMHPPQLIGVISRKPQPDRTRVLDMGEVREAAEQRIEEAGQEVPEDFYITGAAVRGEDDKPTQQVVSFTYALPSGRQGKGALPYNSDTVPNSVAAGDEAVRIAEAKKHGLPFIPQQVADALAGAQAPDGDGNAAVESLQRERDEERKRADRAESEKDDLQSQLDELRTTVTALQEAQANLAPAGSAGPGPDDQRPEEPFEDFGAANAQSIKSRLAAIESDEERRALAQSVLAYEQGPDGSNRSTVVKAANEVLGLSG